MTLPAVLDTPFDLVVNEDTSFTQSEANCVVRDYVCAVCHSELQVVYVPNRARVLVVCIEHGNAAEVGRVTRATVSIEMEKSVRKFNEVCRNLPDLWGHLLPPRREKNILLKELGF